MPIIQQVETVTGAVASGTTIIPKDDSIPQITEGDERMTRAVTPLRPGGTLKIDVLCHLSTNAEEDAHLIAALFKDAIAGALAAGMQVTPPDPLNGVVQVKISYRVACVNCDARTFRVRVGASIEGTTTFNGSGGSRLLGGVLASSIIVTEIE